MDKHLNFILGSATEYHGIDAGNTLVQHSLSILFQQNIQWFHLMIAFHGWLLLLVIFILGNFLKDIPETATSRSLGMTMVPGNHVTKCLLKSE